jgi:DNA (cytosine-5)-methyltransferase 1
MNHRDKLLETYKVSSSVDDIADIDSETKEHIKTTGENINSQKGVFTVLVTLVTHKIITPSQDVRYHQKQISDGFSGRNIDTKYITPTLKELNLPAPSETGWRTATLEQPFPYTLDYPGKIKNEVVKTAFLQILDYLEKNPIKAENLLRLLMFEAIKNKNASRVIIQPLANPELITIKAIIESLEEHFSTNYKTRGGSKLPVLAFYAIYQCLIKQMSRYKDCVLAKLGSHTSSDKTSKSAGDIEVVKNNEIFEAVEIKLDKPIDSNIVRIAIEKIKKFNPLRYYILSDKNVTSDTNDKGEIDKLIEKTKTEHGCQIITNGVIQTIKYYLRLLEKPDLFVENYSSLVSKDTELKPIHKLKWNEIVEKTLNTKANNELPISEIASPKAE